MKKTLLLIIILVAFEASSFSGEGQEPAKKGFNVSADIFSNYIWRGTRLGTGPHIQPAVTFSTGGFTAGVWGSFNASGYSEADPYISYTFPFGLSLGIIDYYYPGLKFSDVSVETGSHAFELNTGYKKGGFNISGNYIFNEAGGAGSAGNDLYFEAGYSFSSFNIFAGAGNGWHTSDREFNLCHLGIGTVKVINITDKFSIPMTGRIIFNPDREDLFVVVGFSF